MLISNDIEMSQRSWIEGREQHETLFPQPQSTIENTNHNDTRQIKKFPNIHASNEDLSWQRLPGIAPIQNTADEIFRLVFITVVVTNF